MNILRNLVLRLNYKQDLDLGGFKCLKPGAAPTAFNINTTQSHIQQERKESSLLASPICQVCEPCNVDSCMVLWWKCNVHTLRTTKLPDANFQVLGIFFINLNTIWCKWPFRIAKNGHNYGGRGNIFFIITSEKPAVLWSWNREFLVTFSIIFHVMHNQLP